MTSLEAFKAVALEAIKALGLTPVENYVVLDNNLDRVIVRAWTEPGKTFVKLYVDYEQVLLAQTDRKPVRDLLKYDLERCKPIPVRSE